MTRKEALREAIQIVSSARIGKVRKEEILAGLELCLGELPFAHWSREAIFDACDTWVGEHGALTLRAFTSPDMPSHSTVKNRFGMTARQFRDRYYPLARPPAAGIYRGQDVEEWNRCFREEFRAMGCTGQADYNRRRSVGLPTWNTMAAMNGVGNWGRLLEKLGLSTCKKSRARPGIKVRIG